MAPLDGGALLMERDSATWTAAIVWPRAARMKRINGVLQEGEGETGGSTDQRHEQVKVGRSWEKRHHFLGKVTWKFSGMFRK